ncbi:ribonuclease III [Obba rivulosa]|uniref:Ribonuclease III n=1 Tax=Obba rivulosa TaxID=1052685 RepID=A0A8E2DPX8_9APHY|nr:ribonuclease III [Obba rivulosa]
MLKIWKQAWKNSEAGATSDPKNITSHTVQNHSTRENLSDVVAKNSAETVAEITTPTNGVVRPRDPDNLSLVNGDGLARPAKRRKMEAFAGAPISLGLLDLTQDAYRTPLDQQDILSRAQIDNVIAIVETAHVKHSLIRQMLARSVDAERRRAADDDFERRTILFVVDDNSAISRYATDLANLDGDFQVSAYTLAMHTAGTDRWSRVRNHDIVVVSANLLLDSLQERSINLLQSHLLIISDADRIPTVEAPHPMIRIIAEYYSMLDPSIRPPIFSLFTCTAGRKDRVNLSRHEALLDAVAYSIQGDDHPLPDGDTFNRPMEVVFLYDPHRVKIDETSLAQRLREADKGESIPPRLFKNSRRVLRELGRCAADLYWRTVVDQLDQHLQHIISNWTFDMPNVDTTSPRTNVAPKFGKLVEVLKACEPYAEEFRCVILVRRRAVANMIAELLRQIDDELEFIHPAVVTGETLAGDSDMQAEILGNFTAGLCNVLIVTKASEDLDVPKCSVVIRFNVLDSQLSYANSQALSAGRQSHLVHMAERGNNTHHRILSHVTTLDSKLQEWLNHMASNPCGAVPPGSLHESIDPYRSDDEDIGNSEESLKDPVTSALLFKKDAIGVIYRLAASLHKAEDFTPRPLFDIQTLRSESDGSPLFKCTVHLPESPSLPLAPVTGPPCPTVSEARRVACFQVCKEMADKGILDYHLFPQTPFPEAADSQSLISADNVNAEEAVKTESSAVASIATHCYPRKRPDFWANSLPVWHGRLYPTIATPGTLLDQHHAPMLILTRLPLPELSPLNVWSLHSTQVHFQRAAPIDIDEEQLNALRGYTIRICRLHTNKPFTCTAESMPYFFAPLAKTWEDSGAQREYFPSVAEHIPWDDVRLAAERHITPLLTPDKPVEQCLEENVPDAVIQDRMVEFTMRYYTVGIRPDLNPLTKADDSVRELPYGSFFDYCKARKHGFEGWLAHPDAPMVQVLPAPPLVNNLNPVIKPPTYPVARTPAKYLIPELCHKLTIPASSYRTTLLLPCVMRRIDDQLLIKELNAKLFQHSINERYLLPALFPPSADTEFDYERLEFLGDAYLKYLSSTYCFVTMPRKNEGALHYARQRFISNKALRTGSVRLGLPSYVQSKAFVAKLWTPSVAPEFEEPKPKTAAAAPAAAGTTTEKANGDTTAVGASATANAVTNEMSMAAPAGENGVKVETIMAPADKQADTPGTSIARKDAAAVGTSGAPSGKDAAATDSLGNGGPGKDMKMVVQTQPVNGGDQGASTSVEPPKTPATPKRSKKKRQKDEMDVQWLGDKVCADVVEAIIGAAYLSGGQEVALRAAKVLNVGVTEIEQWSDFGRRASFVHVPPSTARSVESFADMLRAVERIVGCKFEKPHLLLQALTHASIRGYEVLNYDRLEFLGDAILDFLVIRYVYERHHHLSSGGLTLLKVAMVSNHVLAAFCVSCGLWRYALHASPDYAIAIQAYVEQINIARDREERLAASEGRLPGQYWHEIEPPKILPDVVEAVLGALYVSDGFSEANIVNFFDNVFRPFYDRHIRLQTLSQHPKKTLFELMQAEGCHEHSIVREIEGYFVRADVVVHDVVLASASDPSTAAAVRRAALWALDALEGDPDFIARTCDCGSKPSKKKQKAMDMATAAGYGDDDDEMLAVESVLGLGGSPEDRMDEGR